MPRKNFKLALTLVLLAGFLLRLLLNFYHGFALDYSADDKQYFGLAINLLQNFFYSIDGVSATTYRLPLFPLLITGLFKLFGVYPIIPRIFLSLIDVLNAYLLFKIADALFRDRRIAWGTLLFWLFSPLNIYFTLSYTIDILLVFFFLGAYLAILCKQIYGAAILFTLAALTKSVALGVFLIFVFWLLLNKFHLRKVFTVLMIFFLGTMPWGLYNLKIIGAYSLGETGIGVVMWGAHNENTFRDWRRAGSWQSISELKEFAEYEKITGEKNKDKFAFAQAKNNILNNLNKLPRLALNKLVYYWNFCPRYAEEYSWKNYLLGFVSFGWILPLFLLGVIKLWDKKELFFLWWYFIYFNFVAVVTYGSIRMRMPLTPFILMIGFWGLFNYATQRSKSG